MLIIGSVMQFMAFWVLKWWALRCRKHDIVRCYAVFGEVDGWVSYQKWQVFLPLLYELRPKSGRVMFFNSIRFLHIIVDICISCCYKDNYRCTRKMAVFRAWLRFFGKNVVIDAYEKSQCKQMIVFACIVICVDKDVVWELLPLLISSRGQWVLPMFLPCE